MPAALSADIGLDRRQKAGFLPAALPRTVAASEVHTLYAARRRFCMSESIEAAFGFTTQNLPM